MMTPACSEDDDEDLMLADRRALLTMPVGHLPPMPPGVAGGSATPGDRIVDQVGHRFTDANSLLLNRRHCKIYKENLIFMISQQISMSIRVICLMLLKNL